MWGVPRQSRGAGEKVPATCAIRSLRVRVAHVLPAEMPRGPRGDSGGERFAAFLCQLTSSALRFTFLLRPSHPKAYTDRAKKVSVLISEDGDVEISKQKGVSLRRKKALRDGGPAGVSVRAVMVW